MSIDKDFQRHFETKDIPFKKVLENFKGVLKKEYEKTPLVKDFVKYYECLTDKNTDKEDAHTKWLNTPPGQLPKNTLSHDITQTPIYKALQAIQGQIKDFQDKRHYEQDKDYKAHGEANAAMITEHLKKLPGDLANAIKQEILDDSENRDIVCTVIVEWMMGGRNLDPEPLEKRYREAKMYFDVFLKKNNVNPVNELTINDVFLNEWAHDKCFEILEETEILISGKPNNLTARKAGKVGGVIDALNDSSKIFKTRFTKKQLLSVFNALLNTNYKEYKTNGKDYLYYKNEVQERLR